MAHAQKPDFVFRRNGRVHLNGGGVSSADYWPAGFVLLVQACVLQSCDAYWLPTPFSCFPFTSPPVPHRVPSHFNWTLLRRKPDTSKAQLLLGLHSLTTRVHRTRGRRRSC